MWKQQKPWKKKTIRIECADDEVCSTLGSMLFFVCLEIGQTHCIFFYCCWLLGRSVGRCLILILPSHFVSPNTFCVLFWSAFVCVCVCCSLCSYAYGCALRVRMPMWLYAWVYLFIYALACVHACVRVASCGAWPLKYVCSVVVFTHTLTFQQWASVNELRL